MKLHVTCTAPCEEIAAEPGTARVLTASLHAPLAALAERNGVDAPASLPVVTDSRLRPGVVRLRPRSTP